MEGEGEAADASSSSPATTKLAKGGEGCSNINNANGDNSSSGEEQSINNANQVTNKTTTNTSAVNRANSTAPSANLNASGDRVASAGGRSDEQTKNTDFSGTPWDAMESSTDAGTLGNGGSVSMDTSNPFDVSLNGSNSANFYARMLMMPHGPVTAASTTTTTGHYQGTYPTLALLSEQTQCISEADCRTRLYLSVKMRGFDSICLQGATDADIIEFTTQAALSDGLEKFTHVSIRHSSITDKGLEVFLASIARSLQSFELIGKLIRLGYLGYKTLNCVLKLYFVRMQRNL